MKQLEIELKCGKSEVERLQREVTKKDAELDALRIHTSENERLLANDCKRLREERHNLHIEKEHLSGLVRANDDMGSEAIKLKVQAEESECARLRAVTDLHAAHQQVALLGEEAEKERRKFEERLKQMIMDRDSLAAMLREVREEVVDVKMRERLLLESQSKCSTADHKIKVMSHLKSVAGQVAALQNERKKVAAEVHQLKSMWSNMSTSMLTAVSKHVTTQKVEEWNMQMSMNENHKQLLTAEREKEQTMIMFNAALRDARDACTVSFRHGAALGSLQYILKGWKTAVLFHLVNEWHAAASEASEQLRTSQMDNGYVFSCAAARVHALMTTLRHWYMTRLTWCMSCWQQAVRSGDKLTCRAASEAARKREIQLAEIICEMEGRLEKSKNESKIMEQRCRMHEQQMLDEQKQVRGR